MRFIFSIMFLILSLEAVAATTGTSTYSPQANNSWRRSTAIVLFSGIGGAILGLSTLSFYGKPQEHTNNINSGALFGAFAGVGYLFYEAQAEKQAAAYNNYYSYQQLFSGDATAQKPLPKGPQFSFNYDF